jgi:probable HAF family extracellular repeat protein
MVVLLCTLVAQSSGAAPAPTARWEVVALGAFGGRFSRPIDVNSRGVVVGDAETRAGDSHAFIWRSGRMRDLGTLGGEMSSADAVNDRGQVVGTSETRSGATHAFVWQDGRMTDLGTLGGETSTHTR